MPVTFGSYLLHRLPALLGVDHVTGIIRHQQARLPFGVIAGEFRRYITTNRLHFNPADLEKIVVKHRRNYNAAIYDSEAELRVKLALIEALDKHGDALRRANRLAVIPPGQLTARVRPLKPGYSIAGGNTGAGTIAGFIRAVRNRQVQVFVLSNSHVLAESPVGAGDQSLTYQPARRDGGGEAVGRLAYYTRLSSVADNPLDAGMALLDQVVVDPRYGELGELTGVRNPVMGETLRMYARTSGYVEAIVESIGIDAVVSLEWIGGAATFTGVTRLTRGSAFWVNKGGDSGCLWIGSNRKAVLLGFSGGEDYTYGQGFPMPRVIEWARNVTGDPRAGLMGIDGAVFG